MKLMGHIAKPVLFLDLDLTLFDTSKLYDWLGDEAESRAQKIADVVTGLEAPPDFRALLYPDTMPFLLRMHERFHIVIVTFSLNTKWQQMKLSGARIAEYVDGIIMTQGEKGEEIAQYLDTHNIPRGLGHVFIDDSPRHIANAKVVVPDVRSIRIERVPPDADEIAEAARDPDLIIHSLEEFAIE